MPKTSRIDGGQQSQKVSLDENSIGELARRLNEKQKKPRRTKNEWRSIFAFLLLAGYLLIIGFVVITDQIWGDHTNATDLITTVGTLLSSPLSFVIGYYYNKDKNG